MTMNKKKIIAILLILTDIALWMAYGQPNTLPINLSLSSLIAFYWFIRNNRLPQTQPIPVPAQDIKYPKY
jgi:hypothetical protein